MTEPSSAPIEDGDLLPPEVNTDNSEAPVFEDDKLEDFDPSVGWPDPGFEGVAFSGSAPQLDEGTT